MPDGVSNVHPFERVLLPDGGEAEIDLEMVPLVRVLWAMDLTTSGSCQDLGESIALAPEGGRQGRSRHAAYLLGQAWLKMPVQDARTMLTHLARTAVFAERFGRWTHPDAWEGFVYLLPEQDSVQISPWAQIHFPRPQLPEVVNALNELLLPDHERCQGAQQAYGV